MTSLKKKKEEQGNGNINMYILREVFPCFLDIIFYSEEYRRLPLV